jgi:hypothetical protein
MTADATLATAYCVVTYEMISDISFCVRNNELNTKGRFVTKTDSPS